MPSFLNFRMNFRTGLPFAAYFVSTFTQQLDRKAGLAGVYVNDNVHVRTGVSK